MLYHLFSNMEDWLSGFRLIHYITFRATFAAILAFLVATVVGPGIVRSLSQRKINGYSETGSDEVDSQRSAKADVPTMGGVILLIGVSLSGFLFARLDTPYTWIVLLSFLAFGALGALDDWKKLTDPESRGISEKQKLFGQLGIALLAIGSLYALGNAQDDKACRVSRGSPRAEVLIADDSEDHHFDLGIVVGLSGGGAKFRDKVDYYELNLEDPIEVGEGSAIPELKCMRAD